MSPSPDAIPPFISSRSDFGPNAPYSNVVAVAGTVRASSGQQTARRHPVVVSPFPDITEDDDENRTKDTSADKPSEFHVWSAHVDGNSNNNNNIIACDMSSQHSSFAPSSIRAAVELDAPLAPRAVARKVTQQQTKTRPSTSAGLRKPLAGRALQAPLASPPSAKKNLAVPLGVDPAQGSKSNLEAHQHLRRNYKALSSANSPPPPDHSFFGDDGALERYFPQLANLSTMSAQLDSGDSGVDAVSNRPLNFSSGNRANRPAVHQDPFLLHAPFAYTGVPDDEPSETVIADMNGRNDSNVSALQAAKGAGGIGTSNAKPLQRAPHRELDGLGGSAEWLEGGIGGSDDVSGEGDNDVSGYYFGGGLPDFQLRSIEAEAQALTDDEVTVIEHQQHRRPQQAHLQNAAAGGKFRNSVCVVQAGHKHPHPGQQLRNGSSSALLSAHDWREPLHARTDTIGSVDYYETAASSSVASRGGPKQHRRLSGASGNTAGSPRRRDSLEASDKPPLASKAAGSPRSPRTVDDRLHPVKAAAVEGEDAEESYSYSYSYSSASSSSYSSYSSDISSSEADNVEVDTRDGVRRSTPQLDPTNFTNPPRLAARRQAPLLSAAPTARPPRAPAAAGTQQTTTAPNDVARRLQPNAAGSETHSAQRARPAGRSTSSRDGARFGLRSAVALPPSYRLLRPSSSTSGPGRFGVPSRSQSLDPQRRSVSASPIRSPNFPPPPPPQRQLVWESKGHATVDRFAVPEGGRADRSSSTPSAQTQRFGLPPAGSESSGAAPSHPPVTFRSASSGTTRPSAQTQVANSAPSHTIAVGVPHFRPLHSSTATQAGAPSEAAPAVPVAHVAATYHGRRGQFDEASLVQRRFGITVR